jgi:hypothetical protein
VGATDRDDGDLRSKRGYSVSDLSDGYNAFDEALFIGTLNDWQWCGEESQKPAWYTGEPWTSGQVPR